jgi:CheY-like chemotaxis protein
MLGLDGLAAVRMQRPQLILLDMQLPDIDGLELLRHLKQGADTAAIPVLIVSADATPARVEQALAAGAAGYMGKPFDITASWPPWTGCWLRSTPKVSGRSHHESCVHAAASGAGQTQGRRSAISTHARRVLI